MDPEIKSFTYRLANDQITSIQKDYDKPGWTLWALLIALANSLWILIKELEIGLLNFNYIDTLILFYLFVFLYFGLTPLINIINFGKPDISQDRFEYPSIKVESTRVKIIYRIVIFIFLLFLSSRFIQFESITKVSFKTYVLMMIILQIIFLLGAYIPIPARKNIDIHFFYKLLILIFLSFLPLFVSFQLMLRINIDSDSFFTSLKISSLGFLIFFILDKLTIYVSKNPILMELEKIRHDLAFNLISPEDALERIEIAVDGLKLKQLFKEDISSILNKIHLLSQNNDEIRKNLSLIRGRADELKTSGKEPAEISSDPIISGLFHNIEFALEETVKITRDLTNTRQKVNRKLKVIEVFTKNKPEINDIRNNIYTILKKGEASLLELDKESKQTRKELTV